MSVTAAHLGLVVGAAGPGPLLPGLGCLVHPLDRIVLGLLALVSHSFREIDGPRKTAIQRG